MSEHFSAQIALDFISGTEQTNTPSKSTRYQHGDNDKQRFANIVPQYVLVECNNVIVYFYRSVVNTVYNYSLYFRYNQLKIIDGNKRQNTEQYPKRIFQIILIDMLAENHLNTEKKL